VVLCCLLAPRQSRIDLSPTSKISTEPFEVLFSQHVLPLSHFGVCFSILFLLIRFFFLSQSGKRPAMMFSSPRQDFPLLILSGWSRFWVKRDVFSFASRFPASTERAPSTLESGHFPFPCIPVTFLCRRVAFLFGLFIFLEFFPP